MKSISFASVGWLEHCNNYLSLHRIAIFGILTFFSINLFPFLLYDIVRMGYLTPINYNEGWNVIHTSRFLAGQALYLPLTGLPLTPVNYPPLSFLIIGTLGYITGDLLLTGRVVSLISMLFIGYLIFQIVHNLTSQISAAFVGSFLWLALMVRMVPHYVGMYDPQLLAHVFSVGAFYLYSKWHNDLTVKRSSVLALVCCLALFIKHLLIAVPLTLGITLLLSNRRAFWIFFFAGISFSSLMLFITWFFGGEYFIANLVDLDRATSYWKVREEMSLLFLTRYLGVFFLAPTILLFSRQKGRAAALIYLFISVLIGSYAIRGVGVARNAWFDFFIATSSNGYLKPLSLSMVLIGLIANEWIIGQFFSPDGIVEPSTASDIRVLQGMLILGGFVLITGSCKGRCRYLLVYGTLAFALLPFSTNLNFEFQHILNRDRLDQQEEIYRQDVKLLQSIPGPALFGQLLLGFDAGKTLLFDPFGASQMMISGRISENKLLDPINTKYFTAIVLGFDLEEALSKFSKEKVRSLKPTHRLTWTDNTLKAIGQNYKLLKLKRLSNYYFYLPRKILDGGNKKPIYDPNSRQHS
jgi:hypothetical protein